VSRVAPWIDALVLRLSRHWLAFFILALALFVSLPVAAPVLAASGHDRAAGVIYFAYRATCHQLPHHSWFLFGPEWAYAWPEVQPYTDVDPEQPLLSFHSPLRTPELGYQIAFCQRDTAIWWSMFLTTVLLAGMMRRRTVSPLPFRYYAIALIPIAVDGVTQLLGFRTSTPLLRTLTGALFGAATALLVIPYLALGFRDVEDLAGRAQDRRESHGP
jgi:uncharacterized membrane protein